MYARACASRGCWGASACCRCRAAALCRSLAACVTLLEWPHTAAAAPATCRPVPWLTARCSPVRPRAVPDRVCAGGKQEVDFNYSTSAVQSLRHKRLVVTLQRKGCCGASPVAEGSVNLCVVGVLCVAQGHTACPRLLRCARGACASRPLGAAHGVHWCTLSVRGRLLAGTTWRQGLHAVVSGCMMAGESVARSVMRDCTREHLAAG